MCSMHRAILSARRLREVAVYDPETGLFEWRVCLSNRAPVGSRMGGIGTNGYLSARIDGKSYLIHRLAWLYMTGRWPTNQIDHANMEKTDNRFCNLREATSAQNKWNEGPRKDNKSGVRGVSWFKSRNKWVARARINGRLYVIGYYDTVAEAAAAHMAKVAPEVGEFARFSPADS